MTQTISEVVQGGIGLADNQVQSAATFYEQHRREEDQAILIGLYGEDLQKAIKSAGATLLKYTVELNDEPVYAPLLVPVEELEWYNKPFLKQHYGESTPMFCYAHPPLPSDKNSQDIVTDAIRGVVDSGGVVLWEEYKGKSPIAASYESRNDAETDTSRQAILLQGEYVIENIGGVILEKKSDMFVGKVAMAGNSEGVFEAPSLYEVYEQAVADGSIHVDPQNGPSLERELNDKDVQKVWDIYEKPFERLTADSPVLNGFDKDSLSAMLKDPSVFKAVHRIDGEINVVAFFAQDFSHYTWFNADYYKREYPEYYEKGAILLFPGIVSDESRRGKAYSLSVIDLVTKLFGKRGSDMLISFECSEISTKYIPKIVQYAINGGGAGTVSGLEQPINTMQYRALRSTDAIASDAE